MQPDSLGGCDVVAASLTVTNDVGGLESSMVQQWPTKDGGDLVAGFLLLAASAKAMSKASLQCLSRSFCMTGRRRRMQSMHTKPLHLEQIRPLFVDWKVLELRMPLRTFPYCFNSMDLKEQSRQRRSGLNKLILTLGFSVISSLQGNSQRTLFKDVRSFLE